MNPMLLGFLRMFASPVGAMINKGITAGAAAVVATSVAHGNPLGDVSNIVGLLAVALSTVISGFAASQGVQIPVINTDKTNGVRVVDVTEAQSAGIKPVSGPLSH